MNPTLPPGWFWLLRKAGVGVLWLLGRPYIIAFGGLTAAAAFFLALVVVAVLVFETWWLPFVPIFAFGITLALLVQWLRVRRAPADRTLLFLTVFVAQTVGDDDAARKHLYRLREALEQDEVLAQVFELRTLEPANETHAARVAIATNGIVVRGEVVTAGQGSRWKGMVTCGWPEVTSGVSFFHKPLGVFSHRTSERRPTASEELLPVESRPIEFLVSDPLESEHIAALVANLRVLGAAISELRDRDALARTLLASIDDESSVSSRARSLSLITGAVLDAKAGVPRDEVIVALEQKVEGVDHDDLWRFLLLARFVGEAPNERWSTPEERAELARRAIEAVRRTRPEQEDEYRTELAAAYLEEGKHLAARTILEDIDRTSAGKVEVRQLLGAIAFDARDYASATNHYRFVVQRMAVPPTITALARALMENGELDEAEELFRRAVRMDPLYPHSMAGLMSLWVKRADGTILVRRGGRLMRMLVYPTYVVDGRLSRFRRLRWPLRLYVLHRLRRTQDPSALVVLGIDALYREEWRRAEILLGAVSVLPFSDAARGAALVPVAQAHSGALDHAEQNLEWLEREFHAPTVPAAMGDPQLFAEIALGTIAAVARIEPSLFRGERGAALTSLVKQRFPPLADALDEAVLGTAGR